MRRCSRVEACEGPTRRQESGQIIVDQLAWRHKDRGGATEQRACHAVRLAGDPRGRRVNEHHVGWPHVEGQPHRARQPRAVAARVAHEATWPEARGARGVDDQQWMRRGEWHRRHQPPQCRHQLRVGKLHQ
eukprot:scaffold17585_cov99-Phaeocystis_antarctica.AAC.1